MNEYIRTLRYLARILQAHPEWEGVGFSLSGYGGDADLYVHAEEVPGVADEIRRTLGGNHRALSLNDGSVFTQSRDADGFDSVTIFGDVNEDAPVSPVSKNPGLERIITEGAGVMNPTSAGGPPNILKCADGFSVSVIAGHGTYCQMSRSTPGVYVMVEVGFPSARPEPWDDWSWYAESPDCPTDSVYGYVPVEMVRALVDSHGGEATKD